MGTSTSGDAPESAGCDADRPRQHVAVGPAQLSNTQIVAGFLDESIGAMHGLRSRLDAGALERAIDMLARTDAVWLLGSRRLFPIAAYLEYALRHTDKRVGLISGLGGMQQGEARSIRRGDVLVVISSEPHAPDLLEIVDEVRARGARLIAITDSPIGRSSAVADCLLIVQDPSSLGFRSLASSMGLAQCLFTALAYRLGLHGAYDARTA